jgi:GT2 family glycosyltransferase
MNTNKIIISGSIVLYNSDIRQLICTIKSFAPSEKRLLYLVDNSPVKTDIASIIPDNKFIHYYFTGRNIGYGSGHNKALRMAIQAKTDYHVVLNPDLEFAPDAIDKIVDYMETDHSVIQVMPRVLNKDGELQYLCKLLPTPINLILRRFVPFGFLFKKIDDKYTVRHINHETILNPPSLSGCFIFLRLNQIKEHNLFFDERFFMYCEDVDFIRRIHRIGKTIYYPHVSIIHEHAKESYKLNKLFFAHIKSAVKYFNKYGWFCDPERKKMNDQFLEEIKLINTYQSLL